MYSLLHRRNRSNKNEIYKYKISRKLNEIYKYKYIS